MSEPINMRAAAAPDVDPVNPAMICVPRIIEGLEVAISIPDVRHEYVMVEAESVRLAIKLLRDQWHPIEGAPRDWLVIVKDADGHLELATWNGLYWFDQKQCSLASQPIEYRLAAWGK